MYIFGGGGGNDYEDGGGFLVSYKYIYIYIYIILLRRGEIYGRPGGHRARSGLRGIRQGPGAREYKGRLRLRRRRRRRRRQRRSRRGSAGGSPLVGARKSFAAPGLAPAIHLLLTWPPSAPNRVTRMRLLTAAAAVVALPAPAIYTYD